MPNDIGFPLLLLKDFKLKTPQGKLLKDGLSFEIWPGDVLYLKGENGTGKTTLAKEIYSLSKKQKLNVEFLPQLSSLRSSLPFTLAEVVALSEVQLKELPAELISLEILQRPWNHASGGERKKALLVRSLLKKPDILILDEPFNHLDAETIIEIQSLIWRLVATHELKAIVLATHQEIHATPELASINLKEVRL
jgi:zinc/manganese transport system ATP-binding protein/zinc transport system ATP-binding protein